MHLDNEKHKSHLERRGLCQFFKYPFFAILKTLKKHENKTDFSDNF